MPAIVAFRRPASGAVGLQRLLFEVLHRSRRLLPVFHVFARQWLYGVMINPQTTRPITPDTMIQIVIMYDRYSRGSLGVFRPRIHRRMRRRTWPLHDMQLVHTADKFAQRQGAHRRAA